MILVDTGPFVALFDPQDAEHERCKDILQSLREPLLTTTPVLTETFHLLTPNSIGADRLRDFILHGGVSVWYPWTSGLYDHNHNPYSWFLRCRRYDQLTAHSEQVDKY